MRIRRDVATYAMLNASDLRSAAGMRMPTEEMNAFRDMLSKYHFEEGQPVSAEALDEMKRGVKNVIHTLSSTYIAKKDEVGDGIRKNFNAAKRFIHATEELYMTAVALTGCPDIPYMFGEDIHEEIKRSAAVVQYEYIKDNLATGSTYHAQRKKNAGELRKSYMDQLIADVKSKDPKPDYVGKLVAEYQALQKRQAGHGRVWRFFHAVENNARNELLNEMKEALKIHFPDPEVINIETDTPNKARSVNVESYVEGQFNNIVNDHLENIDEYFNSKSYHYEGNLLVDPREAKLNRVPLGNSEQLKIDTDMNKTSDIKPKEKEIEKEVPTTTITK